ncbi:MAG: TRAP transporter substrate-binding protein [Spirochaetales bacterium]|nr:TRAP transporter substrate-binding protein [Spirochaetales bacterium]
MKKILILAVAVALLAGFAFAGGQQDSPAGDNGAAAEPETFVFKYAHTQSPNHPRSLSMDFFKDQLEKASNGRIEVELFYNGVLGKEAEVLDMVKLGTVQGSRGGLFERANKKFLIYTLPFMFNNTDQVQEVMFGPIGQEINAGALANGLYIPATGVAGGFRNITNNVRPIETVADLDGLKMRTPPIDMTIKTFNAIGANPQQVAYTETYMALKTGVVDGQENPFSNIVDMKFYEAQKYLSLVNWQIHPDPFYVNPDWYNSLPEDLKAIFDSVAESTMKYSNEKWLGGEKDYFYTLKENLEVNEVTPENHKGFVDAAKPVWQGYVDDGYFTWDEINAVLNAGK